MFRLRGSHFAVILLVFNVMALYYLYITSTNETSFWFSHKRSSAEKQQHMRIDEDTVVVASAHGSSDDNDLSPSDHNQSDRPQGSHNAAEPKQITTTVFVTPKAKSITVTKSATLTVTSVSQTTVTVTQTVTKTRTVEVTPKPTLGSTGPKFCKVCGPNDAYCQKYGEHNLARSRAHEGSNSRFKRVLRKGLAGKAIKVGVLGGSVTKGHGLTDHAHNWTKKFLDQLRRLLPMSQIDLVNGAVPATGSDYYSMCFGEHIPDDVDIVIIELAANDQRIESNAVSYEWLLRGLLELPNRPAVLNLQVMTLAFETITFGGDLHIPIAEFYDTPVISLRDMVLPHIFKNVPLDQHYFYVDPATQVVDFRHVSVHGHTIMADLLAAYAQRQICAIEEEKARPNKFISQDKRLPNPNELEDVPRLRLFEEYNRTKVVGKLTPSCQSVRTDRHRLNPIDNKGWEYWTYQSNEEKPYLKAENVGDYAKFEIVVGIMGRVRVTYLRSESFGLGDAFCWIDDDNVHGTRIEGWWEFKELNIARVATVAENVTPGKHIITCQILPETSNPNGGHQFRLIAIDAA